MLFPPMRRTGHRTSLYCSGTIMISVALVVLSLCITHVTPFCPTIAALTTASTRAGKPITASSASIRHPTVSSTVAIRRNTHRHHRPLLLFDDDDDDDDDDNSRLFLTPLQSSMHRDDGASNGDDTDSHRITSSDDAIQAVHECSIRSTTDAPPSSTVHDYTYSRRNIIGNALASSSSLLLTATIFTTPTVSNAANNPTSSSSSNKSSSSSNKSSNKNNEYNLDPDRIMLRTSSRNIPQKPSSPSAPSSSQVEEDRQLWQDEGRSREQIRSGSLCTDESARIDVFETSAPSVVNIDTYVEAKDSFSPNV